MPSKTKYMKRKNKTRKYKNNTKKNKPSYECSLAKLMRGGLNNSNDITETNSVSVSIVRYDSWTKPIIKIINTPTTYRILLENEKTNVVLFINNEINEVSVDDLIDMSNSDITIYTYKYKQNSDIEPEKNEDLKIENEDVKDVSNENISIIGNKIRDTNYYIDNKGVMRIYDKTNNKIMKVLFTDIENEDNNIDRQEEKKILDNLLKKIYDIIPEYMTVILGNKRYIISKENTYIII
jgi:hypothetical protein